MLCVLHSMIDVFTIYGEQVNFCKMNPYAMYLHHLLRDANISGCYSSILVFLVIFPHLSTPSYLP